MARIRSKDTTPETLLRRELWGRGLRYRVTPDLLGSPDIVFPKQRVAVFVDGCFWHGCPEHRKQPKANAEYWSSKLNRRRQRDSEVSRLLSEQGWRVLRVWEHEVKRDISQVAAQVLALLGSAREA